MKYINKICRLYSVTLAILLIFLSFDFPVFAETTTKTIVSFAVSGAEPISVAFGTSQSEVIQRLPSTGTCKMEITTVGDPEITSDGGIKGGSAYTEYIDNQEIAIRWEPISYNPDVAGTYNFIALIDESGYELSNDIMFPLVPVIVEALEIQEEPTEEVKNDDNQIVDSESENTTSSESTNTESIEGTTATEQVSDATATTTTPTSKQDSATTATPVSESIDSSENSTDNSGISSSSSGSTQSSSASSSSTTSNHIAAPSANTTLSNGQSSISESTVRPVEKLQESVDDTKKETNEMKQEEKTEDIPVSLTNKTDTKSEITVGKGKAVINIDNSKAKDVSTNITDDETLLKNILTEEQLKRVAEGATANLRLETNIVKESDISNKDAENIKKGLEEYQKEVPGLAIAGYVDISIYLQMDDEDWNYVSNTNKPVELVISLPDSLKGLSEDYYILRLHDGKTSLFTDNDDNPDTITIETGKFSIYVVMYDSETAEKIEKTEKKEMNILIFFVVALILVLMVQIIYFFVIRKKQYTSEQKID